MNLQTTDSAMGATIKALKQARGKDWGNYERTLSIHPEARAIIDRLTTFVTQREANTPVTLQWVSQNGELVSAGLGPTLAKTIQQFEATKPIRDALTYMRIAKEQLDPKRLRNETPMSVIVNGILDATEAIEQATHKLTDHLEQDQP